MVFVNSFQYPESPIKFQGRDVRAVLDKKDLGLGTLYISESSLCWQGKNEIGFSIGYSNVSLHAVSKDATVYPQECLYIMLDGQFSLTDEAPYDSANEDSDVESEAEVSELILVPYDGNSGSISSMYDAIKECQELNPDPVDMDDNDDEDDDEHLFADAEDEFEEGHYVIDDRGAGDADVNEISRRLEQNYVDNAPAQNGNEDEEFEDAD